MGDALDPNIAVNNFNGLRGDWRLGVDQVEREVNSRYTSPK